MASRYTKGARSERELIEILTKYGYLAVRTAGSGVNGECPDIIALRDGRQLVIECKAWNRNRIAIEHGKYLALKNWEGQGAKTLIAWKLPYKGWKFIELKDLKQNKSSWSITKSEIEKKGKELAHFDLATTKLLK